MHLKYGIRLLLLTSAFAFMTFALNAEANAARTRKPAAENKKKDDFENDLESLEATPPARKITKPKPKPTPKPVPTPSEPEKTSTPNTTTTKTAREILIATGDRTVVYTGPGKFYRPLLTVPDGTELPCAKKTVPGKKGGEFYKVLVILTTGKKAIGYLPTDSPVLHKNKSGEIEEEVDSFEDYRLSKRLIQVAYSHFTSKRALLEIGMMAFTGPGLYVKGWGGGFKTANSTTPVAGVEFGSDALIYKRFSGFIQGALGVFISPKKDALFPGSKDDFSNFLVHAAMGVRYTLPNLYSFSIGGTEAALFNVNNSAVTYGAIASVEIPW